MTSAIATLAIVAIAAGLAWWSWRHVRRRVTHTHRRLERAGLRVRSLVLPVGPRREIARVRLALLDHVEQTQRVLRQPAARNAVPASVRDLLPPLESLATGLDAQLRLWQTEPDATVVLAALPELRDRGRTLIGQALALRTAALPYLEDADRLARRPAENHLRSQLPAATPTTPPLPAPAVPELITRR